MNCANETRSFFWWVIAMKKIQDTPLVSPDAWGVQHGTFSRRGFSVTVREDGSITVRSGDWISKYAYAIYGSPIQGWKAFRYEDPDTGELMASFDYRNLRIGATVKFLPTYRNYWGSTAGAAKRGQEFLEKQQTAAINDAAAVIAATLSEMPNPVRVRESEAKKLLDFATGPKVGMPLDGAGYLVEFVFSIDSLSTFSLIWTVAGGTLSMLSALHEHNRVAYLDGYVCGHVDYLTGVPPKTWFLTGQTLEPAQPWGGTFWQNMKASGADVDELVPDWKDGFAKGQRFAPRNFRQLAAKLLPQDVEKRLLSLSVDPAVVMKVLARSYDARTLYATLKRGSKLDAHPNFGSYK